MKLLFTFLFVVGAMTVNAQKSKVTIEISYTGIEVGYDHVTKDEIYIDGKLVKVTEEHKESEPMKLKIKIPRGSHEIKVVNWTLYKGTWEQTTKDNDYSIDGFFTKTYDFGKKVRLSILYDLDKPMESPIVTFE